MQLPAHLRQSLTWDQGAASQHTPLLIDTGLDIYVCDPQSPWQRGSNENTNGLLRQYFPKSTGLSQHGADELKGVEATGCICPVIPCQSGGEVRRIGHGSGARGGCIGLGGSL